MLNLTLLFLLFFFFVVESANFSPTTHLYLDCGATTPTTPSDDSRSFTSDSSYLSSKNSITISTTSNTDPSLYTTARLFTSRATYKLPVSSTGTHILRLHFFPFTTASYTLSTANFSVYALKRYQLLQNFSPTSLTIKEYFIWADNGKDFVLEFVPDSNFGYVSAIELFTAPTELLLNTSTSGYEDLPQQALETVHRINVGGPKLTPFNDTLWRTWVTDDDYVLQPSFSLNNSIPLTSVKYAQPVTEEVAPRIVYGTARTNTFNSNVSWSVSIVSGYKYLVRLHFCDILSLAREDNISFNVYVGGILADLYSRTYTDDVREAFYREWGVNDPEKFINVSIGTSSENSVNTTNAYLNGLEVFKLNNTDGSLSGEFNALYWSSDGNHGVILHLVTILVPSIVGGLVVVGVMIVLCICVRKRYGKKTTAVKPKDKSSIYSPMTMANSTSRFTKSGDVVAPSVSPRYNFDLQMPLSVILAATNGFSQELVIGSGGFGKVYKGVLEDGTEVAVKRGSVGSKQGYPEFQTEITLLSIIRHKHLVSLIGYCDEQSERILVYEYMEKGPLRDFLYGSPGKLCLSWKQRLEICIGAAKGIHYLHTGFDNSIIHRDVKSTNILLDKDYCAKVSDFGLSKLGPTYGETHVTTAVKGTFGYLDPEYFKTVKLTEKSDVYSFGVMLFEVLCARPVIEQQGAREELNLAEWAVHWHKRGQVEKIVDSKLAGKINIKSLRIFADIAVKCLADFGVDRPTFGDILWNLEYALKLQETEVRRGLYEDSVTVETEGVGVAMASVSSIRSDAVNTSNSISSNAINTSNSISSGVTDDNSGVVKMSESRVFSQLIGGEGR